MNTWMEKEAFQTPKVIETQFQENKSILEDVCKKLKKNPPKFIITIARGSSDHACTFAKYLFETQLQLVCSSAAPSVITLYQSNLNVKDALVIGVSQSGQSPDLCEFMSHAKKKKATTIAFVNNPLSPLAKIAEYIIPLHAGKEHAVAATKSYIASLAALIQFVSYYTEKKDLIDKLAYLPERLEEALHCNWSSLLESLVPIQNTLVIARGYGFGIAQEAALKFKETSQIHAEAFSSAEVLHGPIAMVKKNDPILVFAQNDSSLKSLFSLYEKLENNFATPFLAAPKDIIKKDLKNILPLPNSIHPIFDPLLVIQAFYPMIAKLALRRGYNPDQPPHLKKITKTT